MFWKHFNHRTLIINNASQSTKSEPPRHLYLEKSDRILRYHVVLIFSKSVLSSAVGLLYAVFGSFDKHTVYNYFQNIKTEFLIEFFVYFLFTMFLVTQICTLESRAGILQICYTVEYLPDLWSGGGLESHFSCWEGIG